MTIKRKPSSLVFFLSISLFLTVSCTETTSRAGTPQLREMLFDSIMTLTASREAFSPVKNLHWGIDPLEAMENYRQEIIGADTEEKLFYALEKLSNARNDRHLDISLVENGIRLKESSGIDGGDETVYSSPVKVLPDYSDPSIYFISDLSGNQDHFPNGTMVPGDRVLAVNNVPIKQYEKEVRPYHASSYRPNFRWRMAEDMTVKIATLPSTFYQDQLILELEDKNGSPYTVQLPYLHPDSIPWQDISEPQYPGFKLEHSTPTYDLYLPIAGLETTLILTWYGFRETMIPDVDELMEMAKQNNWLDFNIIIDGTRSRGGSAGAYAMQRFSPTTFKTTFGNLRISDVVPLFTEEKRSEVKEGGSLDSGVPEAMDDGTWLMDWLDNEVTDSVHSRAAYSNSVPFKLAHAPKDSDGLLQPATDHFRGRMVALFVPRRGSHLDQFASIIKDNSIGHIIGMTAGGYSNTWEWQETIKFPGTNQPVIQFMWDIGHTIRPNGEILEGNPALPDELFLLTRNNFDIYYRELLRKALEYLNG